MAPSVNGRTPYEFAQLRRHGTYYLNGGDIHFLVENYLFRVHRYFFERESSFFRDKLTVPATPGRPQQGTEDSNAIVLDVRAQDFEQLMWVFYNPLYSIYETGVPQWASILDLAHRWTFSQVKALTVRELEKLFMTPIDRIVLYQKYEVDENLLVSRYAAVIAREEAITIEEGERLGIRTAMRLTQARERLRSGSDGSKSPLPSGCRDDDVRDVVLKLFEIPLSGSLPAIIHEISVASPMPTPDYENQNRNISQDPISTPAPAPVSAPEPAPITVSTPAPAPAPAPVQPVTVTNSVPIIPEPEPTKSMDHHTKSSTKSQTNLKKAAAQNAAKVGDNPADAKPIEPIKPEGVASQIPKPNVGSLHNGSTDSVQTTAPAESMKSPSVGSALRGLFHKNSSSLSEHKDVPSTPTTENKADGDGVGTDAESDFTGGGGFSLKKKNKKNRV